MHSIFSQYLNFIRTIRIPLLKVKLYVFKMNGLSFHAKTLHVHQMFCTG